MNVTSSNRSTCFGMQPACVGTFYSWARYRMIIYDWVWASTQLLWTVQLPLMVVVYGATTRYPFWRTATANQRRRHWSHYFREWRQVIYFTIDTTVCWFILCSIVSHDLCSVYVSPKQIDRKSTKNQRQPRSGQDTVDGQAPATTELAIVSGIRVRITCRVIKQKEIIIHTHRSRRKCTVSNQ